MSKIGRKPISYTTARVFLEDHTIKIDGPHASFEHVIPEELSVSIGDGTVTLSLKKETSRGNEIWGLHRALLANKIKGAQQGFEQMVVIHGLGYKAQKVSDEKLSFSLGFSHKIEYDIPRNVTVDIDKTGQKLLFKSPDKFVLGNVCDAVSFLRKPEPYKGTGIMRSDRVLIRKAGKTKGS